MDSWQWQSLKFDVEKSYEIYYDMSRVTQKGPLAYFLSKYLFFFFLNVQYFKISLWKS